MSLGTAVGLDPGNIVLDADRAPLPRGPAPSQILGPCLLWPNGWGLKMLLGTKVGLVPGHIVLYEDPAPTPSTKRGGAHSPIFGPCLLWPKGCPSQLLLSTCQYDS